MCYKYNNIDNAIWISNLLISITPTDSVTIICPLNILGIQAPH